jgi:hypothetical protein
MASINIYDWMSLGTKLLSALDLGKCDEITSRLVQDKIKRGELVEYLKEVLGPNTFAVLESKGEALQELKETFDRHIGEIPMQNSGLCWLLWAVLSEIAMLGEKEHGSSLERNAPVTKH